MKVRFKRIPTYDLETDTWHPTSFESQEAFGEFLASIYKEPGEYEFDECTFKWNEQARIFKKREEYCQYPEDSEDFKNYWETEKGKCRKGVIWKNKGKTWYTPGEYYMLLNFLPVPSNKENDQNDDFCSVRDVQYQMGLYIKRAEVEHKHSAILKRRQCMSSNYHAAKFIGVYWFEKTKRLKLLASDDSYISGPQGTWNILESYRDFLNQNTAWVRPSLPEEVGNWEQKEKVKQANGRHTFVGRKSSIIAKTLNKDHKKGIGGPTYLAFYEEAGVAPTMDSSLQFLNPALESGHKLVGLFMAAGSVGDLKDCGPLQKFITYPDAYRILKVPTKYYDATGAVKECALFIPAQYGDPEHVDQYGNSQVEAALEKIKRLDEFNSANLDPKEYNTWKSQNPTTVQEAFAYREDLFYPVKKIQRRQDALVIEMDETDEDERPKKGMLVDENGKLKFIPLSDLDDPKPQEQGYPVNPKAKDKRGVVTIYEDPPEGEIPPYLFFAGVDPIEGGASTTSDSLFSVHVVSRLHMEKYLDEDGVERTIYKGGRLMASYVGRYDDTDDNNRIGEYLIRYYNASAAIERNKRNFIDHMKRKGLAARHVLKKSELPLFKDVDLGGDQKGEDGVWFGASGEAEIILNTAVREHILRPLNETEYKTFRVLDTIKEHWLLEEFKLWHKGKNADRIRSYGLAIMAANGWETTYMKTVYRKTPQQTRQEHKPKRATNLLPSSRPSTHKKRKINLL